MKNNSKVKVTSKSGHLTIEATLCIKNYSKPAIHPANNVIVIIIIILNNNNNLEMILASLLYVHLARWLWITLVEIQSQRPVDKYDGRFSFKTSMSYTSLIRSNDCKSQNAVALVVHDRA